MGINFPRHSGPPLRLLVESVPGRSRVPDTGSPIRRGPASPRPSTGPPVERVDFVLVSVLISGDLPAFGLRLGTILTLPSICPEAGEPTAMGALRNALLKQNDRAAKMRCMKLEAIAPVSRDFNVKLSAVAA